MKYIQQIFWIFLFSLFGELCHSFLPLPLPASIYGLVLMFAALALGLVKAEWVEQAGSFLVGILPVLFVAPAVGLLACWDEIAGALLPIIFIILASTVLVFGTAGKITQLLIGKEGKGDD